MKVILIEDEEALKQYLKEILIDNGYKVFEYDSVGKAISDKKFLVSDLVILDLILKDKRGEEFIREVRKTKCSIPILVLSALGQIANKIDALNIGADDYMVKPFDKEELLARINAIYRRHIIQDTKNQESESDGNTVFFWKQNKVVTKEVEIIFSNKEMALLYELHKNKNMIVRSEDLLLKIWGGKLGYQSNVVQSTMRRLKMKWEKKAKVCPIQNSHGLGYIYKTNNGKKNKR